jgi:hypothetical protein
MATASAAKVPRCTGPAEFDLTRFLLVSFLPPCLHSLPSDLTAPLRGELLRSGLASLATEDPGSFLQNIARKSPSHESRILIHVLRRKNGVLTE